QRVGEDVPGRVLVELCELPLQGRGAFPAEILRPRLLHRLVQPPPEQEGGGPADVVGRRPLKIVVRVHEVQSAGGVLDISVDRRVHPVNDLAHGTPPRRSGRPESRPEGTPELIADFEQRLPRRAEIVRAGRSACRAALLSDGTGDGRLLRTAIAGETRPRAVQRPRAWSSVLAHCFSRRLRRAESSVRRSARPRPRTRSRVAWTVSRTPGTLSSTPSAPMVRRCASRPTRASRGTTCRRSCSSALAATQSCSAARNSGLVYISPRSVRTSRVDGRRPASASRRSRICAIRTSEP